MREQTQVIRWENPPPPKTSGSPGSRSRFEAVAEQLRRRRGVWAVVLEGTAGEASGLASTIRNGKTVCFTPAGDFDAVCRTVGDVCMTYARYLGDGPAPIHTNHVGEEPR